MKWNDQDRFMPSCKEPGDKPLPEPREIPMTDELKSVLDKLDEEFERYLTKQSLEEQNK